MRILLVEDDLTSGLLALRTLQTLGHDATWAETGALAMASLATGRPDLIVMDYLLPDTDGIACLQSLWAAAGVVPAIIITGLVDDDLATLKLKAGTIRILQKPATADELAAAIRESCPDVDVKESP